MSASSRSPLDSRPPGPGVAWPRVVAVTALTLACFAANSLLCRAALATHLIDAASFTAVRIGTGALALSALALARGARPGGGSWPSSLALFGYAAAFSFAYLRIQAGTGALVLFAAVQTTMIGWSLARGTRPTGRQWIGVAVAMGGLAYLVAPGISRPDPVGAVLMVGAGAAWGCYSVRGRSSRDGVATNADNFVRSVPLAVALLALTTSRSASPAGLALAAASGALASGVGYSLWYGVVPLLGATRAAAVQLAVPAVAALGAVAFLGETVTARLAGSGVAVLAGIALVAIPLRPGAGRLTARRPRGPAPRAAGVLGRAPDEARARGH